MSSEKFTRLVGNLFVRSKAFESVTSFLQRTKQDLLLLNVDEDLMGSIRVEFWLMLIDVRFNFYVVASFYLGRVMAKKALLSPT